MMKSPPFSMANCHTGPEKGSGWDDAALKSEVEALNDERIALLMSHLDGSDLTIEDQQRLDALTDRIFEIAPCATLQDWEAARPIEQRLSQTTAFIGMIKRGLDDADPAFAIHHEEMKERNASSTDPVKTTTTAARHLTREEYERLVEEGYFHPDARIELVEGSLCEMPRQTSYHATGIWLSHEALRSIFPEGCDYDIRAQFPLALGSDSEPQPDIAVVPGHFLDYLYAHPTTTVLIIEVADSSLLHDQERKTRLYAREGIQEYWIVNLVDWCLEIYREPKDGVYMSRTVLRDEDSISPLSRPEASIPVASLLPRK